MEDELPLLEGKPEKEEKVKETRVSPKTVMMRLVQHSDLRYMRIYPSCELIYTYQPLKGIYVRTNPQDFKLALSEMLLEVDHELFDLSYINQIYNLMKMYSEVAYPSQPQMAHNYLSFKNGLLNFDT